ncbi:unnamed protein product, partial [Sphacelaria rigidula]
QALSEAVEAAAADVARARSRAEGLTAKAMWTEANARSARLAVSALRKSVSTAQASRHSGRGDAKEALTGGARGGGEWSGISDGGHDKVQGLMDRELADELRRQERLYEALREERRGAVVRAEEARRQREADLKALDEVKVRLQDAEVR